jgi:hypothetical protein
MAAFAPGEGLMETLRASSPLHVDGITLVPVTRAAIRSDRGYWIGAFKEVYAVIVCDAGDVRALGPDSSEIELDALIEKTPNLGAILSKLSAS